MQNPESIHMVFQSTSRYASLYNAVGDSAGFPTPNPAWLYRNINGPIEWKLVDDLGGLYGQTISGTFTVEGVQNPLYSWGAAQRLINQGAKLTQIVSPTTIRLTTDAFSSGQVSKNVEPNIDLHFEEGYILDHELGHVPQVNWQLGGRYLAASYWDAVNDLGIRSTAELSQAMPAFGARSALRDYEYLADSLALLATGGFDGTDEAQALIRDATYRLLEKLVQEKFTTSP
jgi:hypothetical protein